MSYYCAGKSKPFCSDQLKENLSKMIKHFKTLKQKPEYATEYPGIKNIKQRNRMQCNNIHQKRASMQFRFASLINLSRLNVKASGNKFILSKRSSDLTVLKLFSSIRTRLDAAKEHAITQMIRIFEADPEPELVFVNALPEDENLKKHKKTEVPKFDLSVAGRNITAIYAWLLEAYKKIYLSFALDYELNVDPQMNMNTDNQNTSPKIRRFIPVSITALMIAFVKAGTSAKTKSRIAIRKTKSMIVDLYRSIIPEKTKVFQLKDSNNFIPRQQLE